MAWTCSKCTFINPPSQKSTCQICLYSSSSSSLSSSSTPSTSSTPSNTGWSCKACTFSNASDRTKCDMCSTNAPGSLFSSFNFKELDSIGSDEEFDSSVGSVFLPLQPCKRKKQETVDSSDDFRESGEFRDMKKAMTLTGDLDVKTSFSTLKILSYNVWFREDLELYERMKAIGNLIEQHSPDFICFQEVTPNIYGIFQQFKWWKDYRCSISKEMANTRQYFCMLMSKLPIKSFNRKPFSNSIMGRELCLAEIEDHMGKELVVATSHLESPCPAPPKFDQMYSKERVAQAKEALTVLKCSPNVIFGGDMNWNDELDGHFPLPDGWVDAWSGLRSGENGWTYDTKSNQMLSGNWPLQRRLDRFICNLHDFKINGIEMIGMDPIQGISYSKEKKVRKVVQKLVLPVLPSDHYGLLLTISSK